MIRQLVRITAIITTLLILAFNMSSIPLFAAQPEVAKDGDGEWYYYEEGEVNQEFTGLAANNNGIWYVKDGKVDFSFRGFVNHSGEWCFVKGGKLSYEESGLFSGTVDGIQALWLVRDSRVDFDAEGPIKTAEGMRYVKEGRVTDDYTGLAEMDGSIIAMKDGKPDADKTGIFKEEVLGEKAWWYFEEGVLDLSRDTVRENKNGWWKVTSGKVDFDFTGIAENENGSWYIADGKVNFDFNGAITYQDRNWLVEAGKAREPETDKDITLFRAYRVLEKITDSGMSKKEKLKRAWNYVQSMEEVNPRLPHYTGMDWAEVYANDVFVNREGNCLSYAAALAYLAKAIGYKDVYGCNSGGHGWAEINGKIYDPEWALHHDEYSYYGITYETETDQPYAEAIWERYEPGCEWMRIRI